LEAGLTRKFHETVPDCLSEKIFQDFKGLIPIGELNTYPLGEFIQALKRFISESTLRLKNSYIENIVNDIKPQILSLIFLALQSLLLNLSILHYFYHVTDERIAKKH